MKEQDIMRVSEREHESEKEVGLHLQSQWDNTVIYTHLTDLNAIKEWPVLFHGEDNDGVFLCPSIFHDAGISFCHYTVYSARLPFKK